MWQITWYATWLTCSHTVYNYLPFKFAGTADDKIDLIYITFMERKNLFRFIVCNVFLHI